MPIKKKLKPAYPAKITADSKTPRREVMSKIQASAVIASSVFAEHVHSHKRYPLADGECDVWTFREATEKHAPRRPSNDEPRRP